MFNRLWNPANRFTPHEVTWEGEPPKARLRVVEDDTKGILARNRSPDIDFEWAVNPYRGCTHACAYCYARAFHEHLGYGAGSDFERQIVVKTRAPELLQQAFNAPSWKGELVVFSGATDGYQPLESRYGLTRRCLGVCAAYRNPTAVITRSPLILRDLDLLRDLAQHDAVAVSVSTPIWNPDVARALEPGTCSPQRRVEVVQTLSAHGIPVGVSIAPVIPGLTDHDIPRLLRSARAAGARWAWFSPLRLPGSVAEVFQRRLRDRLPLQADRVLSRLRRTMGSSTRFGERFQGNLEAPEWQSVRQLFQLWHRRLGFEPRRRPGKPHTTFRRPRSGSQLGLFPDHAS